MGRVEPLSISERATLERAQSAIVGQSITSVRYWVLPPAPLPADLEVDRIHEVDSVELGFGAGSLVRIRWAMAGADEGITFDVGPEPLEDGGLVVVDVSRTGRWGGLLGQPVTQLRAAWQVPSENSPEMLWAVSFRTAGGGEVSIALGEVRDGTPTYLPDSMVVIFSSAKAGAYQPIASTTSAWGEVLGPA